MISCNKEQQDENICPTITREAISTGAINHFDSTYANATNVVWFNVDSKSICAVFDMNNFEYEVSYDNNGTFISEKFELNNDQKGNHKDANDDDRNDGCECERED